jgi:hypothetical protein
VQVAPLGAWCLVLGCSNRTTEGNKNRSGRSCSCRRRSSGSTTTPRHRVQCCQHTQKKTGARGRRVLFPLNRANTAVFCLGDRAAGRPRPGPLLRGLWAVGC